MKNSKLLEAARPGALGQLARLRRTREQIATSKLSAHEQIIKARLSELEKSRVAAQEVNQLLQTAAHDYEQCLHDERARVDELQKMSLHVSRLSGRLNGLLQVLAQAEQLWLEACAEKDRLTQNLKLATLKHSQAETMEGDARSLATSRQDIRRESEAENAPTRNLSSALFTSANGRMRGK